MHTTAQQKRSHIVVATTGGRMELETGILLYFLGEKLKFSHFVSKRTMLTTIFHKKTVRNYS